MAREAGADSDPPIDSFLESARRLVVVAGRVLVPQSPGDPTEVERQAGRVLTLGLVSETELYFRKTLVGLAAFCPYCADRCADTSIKFSELLKLRSNAFAASLLGDVSFASRHGVESATKSISGMAAPRNSALDKCLNDYDALCHLRHAAVHAGGQIGSKNSVAIGLDPSKHYRVVVDFANFTNVVLVCTNLVRTYNRELHKHIVQTWIARRVLHETWPKDRYLFTALFRLFASQRDGVAARRPKEAYDSFLKTIRRASRQAPPSGSLV